MANRIIKIESAALQLSSQNLIVYADISLDSVPASITYKPYYQTAGSEGYLSADINGLKPALSTGYILTDPDAAKIKFYHGKANTINLGNAKYNEEQRKKAHFKLQKNINVTAVKQAVRNIFTWIPGERILNPEFGSKLRNYLYEGITPYNQEQIMAEIRHCFTEWEPRAHLDKVVNLTDVDDEENNTVRMDIVYSIPSLTDEQFLYRYEGQKRG